MKCSNELAICCGPYAAVPERSVRRRDFITLLASAAAAGIPAWSAGAQQDSKNPRRLGVLFVVARDNPDNPARIAALEKRLGSHGWIDGKTIRID